VWRRRRKACSSFRDCLARAVWRRGSERRFRRALFPVEHVRDARSLLLLKLLFLDRSGGDPGPLLHAQRAQFGAIAERLRGSVSEAVGFDRTLAQWRLETATGAVRFIDCVIDSRSVAPSAR